MRLIASFHVAEPANANLSLESVLTSQAPAAFCTLTDRSSEWTLANLRSRLSHTAADKRIHPPQPIEFATIVCARTAVAAELDAEAVDTPALLYSLVSGSDCSSLRDDDHLHLLFPSAWQSEDAALIFVASVHSLPPLHTTFVPRPLSPHSMRLAEFDRVETVECTVARSATEPLVSTEELARQMHASPDSAERRAYAASLLDSIRSCGFLRLRFSAAELAEMRALYAMQRAYFALPPEEKQPEPPAKKGSAVSDYQKAFGYSSSHACRKEFFVVRQPPKSHPDAAAAAAPSSAAAASSSSSSGASLFPSPISWAVPSNPSNFGSSVFPVFARLGVVCQHLTSLLLGALGAEASKVQELLRDSMEPAQTDEANRFTSVIELFHYSVGDAQKQSAAAAHSSRELSDGAAAAAASSSSAAASSASSSFSAASAASLFVPPPPLPCSIHCDASLLTLIPRCVGSAGLQLYNLSASGWQSVEAQCAPDEGVVFPGDMMQRITNGEILATSHRVAFAPQRKTSADAVVSDSLEEDASLSSHRYSFPFELFLAPSAVVDCASLLSLPPSAVHSDCRAVQSAMEALSQLSANLVSVNKTN